MVAASVLDAEKYRITEAARRLNTHVSTIHRWAQRGIGGVKLRITRVGGRSFVLKDDLEDFIRRRSDPPPATEIEAAPLAHRAEEAGRRLSAIGL